MKKCIFVIISLLLVSCGSKSQKTVNEDTDANVSKTEMRQAVNGLPVIDLQKEYPLKQMVLQDVADVTYIPLEITDNALLANAPFVVTDGFFITYTTHGDVCFFNRDGRLSHTFNRKGGSGEEYGNIYNFCVDDENVYINDILLHKIQVYSYQGEYRRTLNYGRKYTLAMTDYDQDYLLVEDSYDVDIESGESKNAKAEPYLKISKKDGQMLPVSLTVHKKRVRDGIGFFAGDNFVTSRIGMSPLARINRKNVIAEFVLDTVYVYQADNFIPIAVRQNLVKGNDIPMVATLDLLTDRYQLWYVAEKDIDKKAFSMPDPFSLLYDKHTGECVRVEFSDAGGVSAEIAFKKLKNRMSGNLHTLPDNCLLQNYPAHFLMELNEKGALKGELKEIASKLNEDDNPVLMLAKFRE